MNSYFKFLTSLLLGFFLSGGCSRIMEKKSLSDRMDELELKIGKQIQEKINGELSTFPPSELILIALKEEKILEVWAKNANRKGKLFTYPILAASGTTGHKFREGDKQVPEGVYKLEYLNPNSSYHLSMKIDYPNSEDQQMAKLDGRENPGSDIFIHGKNVSIGCIAIGNEKIEELFYLVGKTNLEKVQVWILPYDFRIKELKKLDSTPDWIWARYKLLKENVKEFSE